jgi:hypothetical protein
MSHVPYDNFDDFYAYYLEEHSDRRCKQLHFAGTTLVFLTVIWIVVSGQWGKVWLLPLFGYGPAWIGHFFFEHNRPASFKQPLYSLGGDFLMYYHLLTGKLSFETGAWLKQD